MIAGRYIKVCLTAAIIAAGSAVYWQSRQNYLLFHVFVEMFSIVIAAAVSIVALHSRRIHQNNFLLVLGTSLMFVSLIDLFHLLTYKGMGVFEISSSDLPTQFWVSARLLQITGLLLAFFLHKKRVNVRTLLGFYAVVTAGLSAAVFSGWFPSCYDDALGRLTLTKMVFEMTICVLAMVCLWAIYRNRLGFQPKLRKYLLLSVFFFVLSEISFCLYFDVYGFFNFVGHVLKIVSFYYIYRAIIRKGLERPYQLLFSDLSEAKQRIEHINRDLERKVSERTAVAERRADQLRDLVAELVVTEQKEKKKLAHLLHDHLQQLLAAAKMRASMLNRHSSPAFMSDSIDEICDLLTQSIQCSRELSVELSPPALNEAGLSAGLRWLVDWFDDKHALRVTFTCAPEIRNEIAEEIKIFVFNAAREMLFNVTKHAQVSQARLDLSYGSGRLRLSVEDRGAGVVGDETQSSGFGLFSIKERVELLGGQLAVESRLGKGTTVTVEIPIRIAAFDTVGVHETHAETASIPCTARRKIRVLIADDHQLLREGLTTMLKEERDIEVVAQAADGEGAVRLAEQHVPDVVILDVNMPGLNGVEAARRITELQLEIGIIGLSMHNSPEVEQAMLAAGASACCTKNGPPENLIGAIRRHRKMTGEHSGD